LFAFAISFALSWKILKKKYYPNVK